LSAQIEKALRDSLEDDVHDSYLQESLALPPEDLVELPDGRTTIYGVVSCGECVGVLPFLDPDTVLLVRQYRSVAGRTTWEMPTGGVHFLGEEMVKLALPADETEFIEVHPVPFREILGMLLSGEIVDSMTIIAVLHADRMKGS